LIDDRRVFARMGLSLVHDLAAIEPVLQHQVERAAREWLAANAAPRSGGPRFAVDRLSFELVLQQPDRTEFGIAAKNGANDLCLTLDHKELAILGSVAERRDAAHPHPFPF